jgi:hypothetical protein
MKKSGLGLSRTYVPPQARPTSTLKFILRLRSLGGVVMLAQAVVVPVVGDD